MAVSATFAPDVPEEGIKVELAGRSFDGGRVQAESKRIQRAQDQTELGGRLSGLHVG